MQLTPIISQTVKTTEDFLPHPPRYGQGIEARRAAQILDRPEYADVKGWRDRSHPYSQDFLELMGPHKKEDLNAIYRHLVKNKIMKPIPHSASRRESCLVSALHKQFAVIAQLWCHRQFPWQCDRNANPARPFAPGEASLESLMQDAGFGLLHGAQASLGPFLAPPAVGSAQSLTYRPEEAYVVLPAAGRGKAATDPLMGCFSPNAPDANWLDDILGNC
jgi:hypothetical protein